MIASLMILSLAASAAEPSPQLRFNYTGADFTNAARVAAFDRRLDEAVRVFCAEHRALVAPSHVTNPRVCEQGMRGEVMRRLSRSDRRNYRLAVRSPDIA